MSFLIFLICLLISDIIDEQCKFYFHGADKAEVANDPEDDEFCALLSCRSTQFSFFYENNPPDMFEQLSGSALSINELSK